MSTPAWSSCSAGAARCTGAAPGRLRLHRRGLRPAPQDPPVQPLAGWAGSPAEAERLLVAAGVDPGARGEQLDVADFARVAAARRTRGWPRDPVAAHGPPAAKAPVTARACARSTSTCASAPYVRTATTSCPRSSSGSACTTMSPSGRRRSGPSPSRASTPEGVPTDETNLAWRAAVAVAELGSRPAGRHPHRQEHPRGRGWPAARRTRPPRCWPATPCGRSDWTAPRCSPSAPTSAATSCSASAVGWRSGVAAVSSSSRSCPAAPSPLRLRGERDRPVHPDGVCRSTTGCTRRRNPAGRPRPQPELLAALRAGDAYALASALHNDLEEAALSLQTAAR